MSYSYLFSSLGRGMSSVNMISLLLLLAGAIVSAIASANVHGKFNKYNRIRNSRGLTSNQVCEAILHSAGIYDVRIERIRGNLTDHYSPNEKVLRLSESTYNSTSISAIGVAAHECGHAVQHKVGYGPLRLRSFSVPFANFGSRLSWPILIIGLILGFPTLAYVGIWLFLAVVIFQLITLPVEFNASRRAIQILEGQNLLYGEELKGAKAVLRAAASTYVAALFTTILQLFRMILIANSGRRR